MASLLQTRVSKEPKIGKFVSFAVAKRNFGRDAQENDSREEGGRFHGLPPLKRFKILEKERQELQQQEKRDFQTRVYCLPAKKRVCALKNFSVAEEKESDPDLGQRLQFLTNKGDNIRVVQTVTNKKFISEAINGIKEESVTRRNKSDRPHTGIGKPDLASPAADPAMPVGDEEDDGVVCNVCKGTDADPSDPIVFCDGCNVMVHASCYGYPLIAGIPSGDWFCSQCESRDPEGSRQCCLCPSTEGAMKRTTDGRWAHLFCALFVPEVYYTRAREREGIECGSVPAFRWQMQCGLCGRGGACIQCTEVGCDATFHISCGLDQALTLDYRQPNALTRTPAIVIAFCPRHSPPPPPPPPPPSQHLLNHSWTAQQRQPPMQERRRFKIVPRVS